ncbi:unnamed protein product [Rhodiola kirilowii]
MMVLIFSKAEKHPAELSPPSTTRRQPSTPMMPRDFAHPVRRSSEASSPRLTPTHQPPNHAETSTKARAYADIARRPKEEEKTRARGLHAPATSSGNCRLQESSGESFEERDKNVLIHMNVKSITVVATSHGVGKWSFGRLPLVT